MPFLEKSTSATVNGSTMIDVNGSGNNVSVVASAKRKREGIKLLVESSIPEAIHDSGARGDLGCHPGTREDYIRAITGWGKGEWDSSLAKHAFLMTGPAGAGKSAIAQACADNMEASGHLGASFFFYRPSGWNNPRKFIPTIVYQLTARYPAYRDFIDAIILDDPLVLRKAVHIQFRELIVKPLQKLCDNGHVVGKNTVIIIDGLDECETVDAQIQIINLIATSIHEQTTPFFWAFFSRPEPPITSAFSSPVVMKISWQLPLTVSSDADSDIEAYVRAGFGLIRARYSIPHDITWPKQEDVDRLVSQSAGLFVYPVVAMRYIGNGTSGLEKRLRSVLRLGAPSADNPFSALDRLYLLIMIQIPHGVLFDTMSLLYLDQDRRLSEGFRTTEKDTAVCRLALGLSSAAFYAAISNLYSVLEVTKYRHGAPKRLIFYHKSFPDFLFDETRSRRYFLKSPDVFRHCLKMLVQTLANGADLDDVDESGIHNFTLQAFFDVVIEVGGKLDENIWRQVSEINWNYWHRDKRYLTYVREFIAQIPTDWRRKIIRPSRQKLSDIGFQILANIFPEKFAAKAYVLGKGNRQALMVQCERDVYDMRCDLSSRSEWCHRLPGRGLCQVLVLAIAILILLSHRYVQPLFSLGI